MRHFHRKGGGEDDDGVLVQDIAEHHDANGRDFLSMALRDEARQVCEAQRLGTGGSDGETEPSALAKEGQQIV
jgi:hypothetical protein